MRTCPTFNSKSKTSCDSSYGIFSKASKWWSFYVFFNKLWHPDHKIKNSNHSFTNKTTFALVQDYIIYTHTCDLYLILKIDNITTAKLFTYSTQLQVCSCLDPKLVWSTNILIPSYTHNLLHCEFSCAISLWIFLLNRKFSING